MKLEAEVVPEDIDKILAIKLCSKAELDLLGWSYNEDGTYTVKSGYWLSTHLPDYDNGLPIYGDVNIEQRMWKTELPPKIKHFLWKLLSKALPTGSNLKRRHVTRDSLCKRCYLEEETEKHLFFDCPYAAQVWRASGINNLIINSTVTSLEEKIQTCLQITTSTRLSHFQDLAIWTLWRIWKSRNLLIFQHKNVTWSNVIQQAKNDANEWRTYSTMQLRQSSLRSQSSQVVKKSWSRPQPDWIKCNIDGSFINQDIPSTTGWILRDSNGVYKGAGQAMGNRVKNAFESELQSLIIAMQHCWSKGYKKVIFESDCRKMISILNQQGLHFDGYNWIREINWWRQRFQDIKFTWISREGNRVADVLAKNHLPPRQTFVFHSYVPAYITNLLHQDYVNSNV